MGGKWGQGASVVRAGMLRVQEQPEREQRMEICHSFIRPDVGCIRICPSSPEALAHWGRLTARSPPEGCGGAQQDVWLQGSCRSREPPGVSKTKPIRRRGESRVKKEFGIRKAVRSEIRLPELKKTRDGENMGI